MVRLSGAVELVQLALQEVALVESQVSVVGLPETIEVAEASRETLGFAGGFVTLTTVLTIGLTPPFAPLHLIE